MLRTAMCVLLVPWLVLIRSTCLAEESVSVAPVEQKQEQDQGSGASSAEPLFNDEAGVSTEDDEDANISSFDDEQPSVTESDNSAEQAYMAADEDDEAVDTCQFTPAQFFQNTFEGLISLEFPTDDYTGEEALYCGEDGNPALVGELKAADTNDDDEVDQSEFDAWKQLKFDTAQQ